MSEREHNGDAKRQLRDLASYIGQPPTEGKKKVKPPIESYEDIIEQKPSIRKVREYYKSVLENIAEVEVDFG